MSSEPVAHFQWSLKEGVAVVEVLSRELNQPHVSEEFEAQLRSLLDPRVSDGVLIDFRHTRSMSSTAFGALFGFVEAAKSAGVRVAACGMAPAVQMGANILSLDQFIPVVADEAAGLAALGARGVA